VQLVHVIYIYIEREREGYDNLGGVLAPPTRRFYHTYI